MLSKHLQLVEEEFDSRFMNNGVNGILDDKFQDEKMLLVKDFLLSQIRTAVEKTTKEIYDTTCDKMNKEGYVQINDLLEILQNYSL
jgi:hypothetical protein